MVAFLDMWLGFWLLQTINPVAQNYGIFGYWVFELRKQIHFNVTALQLKNTFITVDITSEASLFLSTAFKRNMCSIWQCGNQLPSYSLSA